MCSIRGSESLLTYQPLITTAAGNLTLGSANKTIYLSATFTACSMDNKRGFLYVYELNRQSIYRTDVNTVATAGDVTLSRVYRGMSRHVLIKMAIEWVTGNVYWVDPGFRWLGLYSSGSAQYRVIIHDDMELPISIAVDSTQEYGLFVS